MTQVAQKYFFDSNFIIGAIVKDDHWHRKAKTLWIKLLAQGCTGFYSGHVISECLWICLKIAKRKQDVKNKRGAKESLVDLIKKDANFIKQHEKEIRNFWSVIRKLTIHKKLELVDCTIQCIDSIIGNMVKYGLTPSDAFHLEHAKSYCQNSGIPAIVTNDKDFHQRVIGTPLDIVDFTN